MGVQGGRFVMLPLPCYSCSHHLFGASPAPLSGNMGPLDSELEFFKEG